MTTDPQFLTMLAERALQFVVDGQVVGLGTGHAAMAFIEALGQSGLQVRGVATSQASADLARRVGIPLATLDEVAKLDVAIDGADEVTSAGDLIKGYGGALLREKIVACSAQRLVILVGEEKQVPILGSRGRLPVEVVPFARSFCARRIERLGFASTLRQEQGEVFVTDNGNHILDVAIPPLDQPQELEHALKGIPGVVETGLFLGYAESILLASAQGVRHWSRSGPSPNVGKTI